jgi:hypothetical protein
MLSIVFTNNREAISDCFSCINYLKPLRKPLNPGKIRIQIVAIGRRFWYYIKIKRPKGYHKVSVGNVG